MPQDELAVPQWRSMDAKERSVAYSPSSALSGPIDPFIQSYFDRSAAAYEALDDVVTLRYGDKPSQSIDVVRPVSDEPVPTLAFVHGGYWQELSKRESFGPAPDVVAQGVAYAAVDYTLAPNASIAQIVDECVAALRCLKENAGPLGLDAERIVVAGSSAGAHLAAMTCIKLGLAERPKAAVLLSGIYDLEPLVGTYINDAVGLTAETVGRVSPITHPLEGFPKSLVAWGAQETDEFKRQSRMFANALCSADTEALCLEIDGRNHFNIIDDLASASALGRQVIALAKN